MESDNVSATLKRPVSLAVALAFMASAALLPAAATAQAIWPADAALSDNGNDPENTSALPFYLKRPLIADELFNQRTLQWGGQSLDAGTQVLPVLRSGDGRIEALLFIDSNDRAPSLNPVERLLQGESRKASIFGSTRIGAGLRVQGNDRLTLGADLGQSRSNGMALLCNEDIGLATTLSSLSQHCLLAELGGETDPLSPFARQQTSEQHIGASLDLAEHGLDLSFGLSWLQSNAVPMAWSDNNPLTGSTGLLYPSWEQNALGQFGLRSQGIGVRGLLDLGSRRWLSLDGQVSRTRVDHGVIDSLMPSEWNSGRLGLGMGFGDFSGRISGHVTDIGGSDSLWGGLDIGLSWRTPWRAALTIGAKNVVSGGNKTWPQENAQALDEAQSRIPYVQYQQDL